MGNWYDEYRKNDQELTVGSRTAVYAVYEFPTDEQAEDFLEEVGGAPIGDCRVALSIE